jgi:hypothetical protein
LFKVVIQDKDLPIETMVNVYYYLCLLTLRAGCFSRIKLDDYKSYVPGFRHVDPSGKYHPITLGSKIAFAVVGTSQNVTTALVMQDLIEMFGFSFVIADSSHCEDGLSGGFEDGTYFFQEFSRISDRVQQILHNAHEPGWTKKGPKTRDVREYCISDFSEISEQLKKAGYSWQSLTKKKGDIWIYFMPTAFHLDYKRGIEDVDTMVTEYGLDSQWMGVSSGGFIVPVCYDSDGKC